MHINISYFSIMLLLLVLLSMIQCGIIMRNIISLWIIMKSNMLYSRCQMEL